MNYKEVIESRYNRQKWQLLLHDIFGSRADLWASPYEINTNSNMAKQAFWLGTITLADDETIAVYEVELSDKVDIERNRRGIRDMLLTEWRNRDAGAFMFCYRKNESVLRFSYVSEAWNFADDGSYTKESTDTKRFTYLLGEGHRSRTAIQQFEKLKASQLKLKDLTKAFSVEAVSDMFFNEYKKNYEDIIQYITGKRMVKVANKWEEKVINEPCEEIMQEFAHFPNPEKSVRDYVKKLMGRLVFLQFLQKKGWLGVPANEPWGNGNPEFIQGLFANCADKDHFVDKVLEELFNDLNTERTNDLVSSAVGHNIRVPYLNGGLFEREATDETEFPLPAKYMQQMLDFFASYNFTIDENDPDDAEVGVDPEMLGRIFENLLEDNKDKGAFYTPKEIVTYMCRESLIAYLQTDIEDEATKEAIRQFVTTHEKNDKLPADTDQKLKDVKICDPAIGSGAFPMGLLKELFQCRTALEGIEQSKAAEIKKHIIQNNIYGVDIERGAVDIARLRFWLSLIVDEENPQALPNLDYKIVEGNSLITTFDGQYIDLEKGKGEARYRPSLINIQKEKKLLQEEQKRFFTLTGDEKYRSEIAIKKHILNTIWYQLDFEKHSWQDATIEQVGLFGSTESKGRKKNKAQVAEFTPERQEVLDKSEALQYLLNDENKSLQERAGTNIPFFEWETVFSDVFDNENIKGFDIVIGNPPYINVQLMTVEEKQYQKHYKSFFKRCDMFCLFLELGLIRLSSERGVVTLIIPSVVHSNMSYQKIRDVILNNHWLQEVHYTGGDVFNEPTVDTTILICNKFGNKNIVLTDAVDFAHPKSHKVEADYFIKYKNVISIGDDQGSGIFDKLFNPEFDIVDHHYNVFQGIVTGNNPAFTFDSESEAIGKGIDISLLHPFCHGRDIERFKVRSRDRRMLYIDGDVNIDYYPNTKKWLLNFKDALDTRREVRRGVINWCCLQWPRVKSELDLKEKILVQNTRNEALKIRMVATIDDCGVYGTQGLNFIIPKHKDDSLRYLLGILNSKLINYLFATKFLNLAIKAEYVKQIRIPTADDKQIQYMESLVNQVLECKQNDIESSVLESKIDDLVYQLYGLTEKEIEIVDGSN